MLKGKINPAVQFSAMQFSALVKQVGFGCQLWSCLKWCASYGWMSPRVCSSGFILTKSKPSKSRTSLQSLTVGRGLRPRGPPPSPPSEPTQGYFPAQDKRTHLWQRTEGRVTKTVFIRKLKRNTQNGLAVFCLIVFWNLHCIIIFF